MHRQQGPQHGLRRLSSGLSPPFDETAGSSPYPPASASAPSFGGAGFPEYFFERTPLPEGALQNFPLDTFSQQSPLAKGFKFEEDVFLDIVEFCGLLDPSGHFGDNERTVDFRLGDAEGGDDLPLASPGSPLVVQDTVGPVDVVECFPGGSFRKIGSP